ncbi:chloride channel protein, partial [Actinomyces sp. 217892]|uniref:chloride channel protein n=1 Tax=Actinomyces sp. 217892 TaxID=2927827 RepID=UPI0028935EF4
MPRSPVHPCASASHTVRLLLAVVLAGAAAGLVGIAMALLLEGFETLFYGVAEGSLPERVEAATTARRVLAPAVGGLLAGVLWWWQRATGGVIGVERVVADLSGDSARRMGLLRPFGDAVLQVLTVGSGNSVGREGAPRLAAGAVAVRVARSLGLDRSWGPLLVASAAGAGLAAMYNAPLGGAAYAVELVMLSGTRRRGALLAIPVSVVATLVSWLHSGGRASLEMPLAPFGWAALVGCLVVVPVAAGAGLGGARPVGVGARAPAAGALDAAAGDRGRGPADRDRLLVASRAAGQR